jgi:hypothetical protein
LHCRNGRADWRSLHLQVSDDKAALQSDNLVKKKCSQNMLYYLGTLFDFTHTADALLHNWNSFYPEINPGKILLPQLLL